MYLSAKASGVFAMLRKWSTSTGRAGTICGVNLVRNADTSITASGCSRSPKRSSFRPCVHNKRRRNVKNKKRVVCSGVEDGWLEYNDDDVVITMLL